MHGSFEGAARALGPTAVHRPGCRVPIHITLHRAEVLLQRRGREPRRVCGAGAFGRNAGQAFRSHALPRTKGHPRHPQVPRKQHRNLPFAWLYRIVGEACACPHLGHDDESGGCPKNCCPSHVCPRSTANRVIACLRASGGAEFRIALSGIRQMSALIRPASSSIVEEIGWEV
jgi:hypothetical protein